MFRISPTAGSCGTALYLGRRVVVEDIATDPLWAKYRGLALQYGLRACWSEPIYDRRGEILGTFAIYCRAPATPTANHLEMIESAAHLAGIAMERQRMDDVLRNQTPSATPPVRNTVTRTLLLVEDHQDTLQVMSRLLKHLGYSVTTAMSVADALKAIDGGTFDVLVCDLSLPDGSGLEVMRVMKSKQCARGIALSGFADQADRDDTAAAGFDRHLMKPVTTDVLDQTIKELLG